MNGIKETVRAGGTITLPKPEEPKVKSAPAAGPPKPAAGKAGSKED
ncbi:MAG: hypothetical protein P1P89_13835 [Desulfobacterales bacterium]|nr:hypothetical protein [Desulfobacterales bacterium]